VVEQHEMEVDDWRDRYEKAEQEKAQLAGQLVAARNNNSGPSEVRPLLHFHAPFPSDT
jgi:hypothetical protein